MRMNTISGECKSYRAGINRPATLIRIMSHPIINKLKRKEHFALTLPRIPLRVKHAIYYKE